MEDNDSNSAEVVDQFDSDNPPLTKAARESNGKKTGDTSEEKGTDFEKAGQEHQKHRKASFPNVINKMDSTLIIDSECLDVLHRMKQIQTGPTNYRETKADLRQPYLLDSSKSEIFDRLKVFFSLQERLHTAEKLKRVNHEPPKKNNRRAKALKVKAGEEMVSVVGQPDPDAYPPFLSPFGYSSIKTAASQRSRTQRMTASSTEGESGDIRTSKAHKAASMLAKSYTISSFMETLRKTDENVANDLQEHCHQTTSDKGFRKLFASSVEQDELLLAMFPDFTEFLFECAISDEGPRQLVNAVRTRIRAFEKLKHFLDAPKEDTEAKLLVSPTYEVIQSRKEMRETNEEKWHELTEQRIDDLAQLYKENCARAKTGQIQDGTQEVVRNQRKIDRVFQNLVEYTKEEKIKLPYSTFSNIFCIACPWSHNKDKIKVH